MIHPKNNNTFEITELVSQCPDIIVEENAVGDKSIKIIGYEPRHVALMVDGVKINTPSMNSIQAIPVEQIDHIEVLPGNASSHSGNAAMGGVINVVTKKPRNIFTQDILMSSSSWDNYTSNSQTNVTLGSSANLINLFWHKGKNDFPYFNTQEGRYIKRGNNDIAESSFSAKSNSSLDEGISSLTSFQWYKAERGIPGQTTDYIWYKKARAHVSRLDVNEHLILQNDETTHELILSYQASNSHYINEIDNPFFAYDSENQSQFFDASWQYDHLLWSHRSRLKSGYRYETYSFDDNLNSSQSIPIKRRNTLFVSYESSIPLHLLNSTVSLIPSLRFDTLVNDQSFLSSNITIEVPRDPGEFQVTFSGGNSYTMPEFTTLFWKGDSRVQGNPHLKAERSYGGKTSIEWTSKLFSIKVTGSYNRIEDLIYWYRSAMGVWMPDNLADAELYGFSGSLTWTPCKIFSVLVNGSKIFPINKMTNSDHYNNFLPNRPLHKLHAEMILSFEPFECSFSVNEIGKQYDNFSNTVEVKGYTTCDTGLSYSTNLSDKLMLHAYVGVKNIFDESYETSRNIPAAGRSFQCSCKLTFQ